MEDVQPLRLSEETSDLSPGIPLPWPVAFLKAPTSRARVERGAGAICWPRPLLSYERHSLTEFSGSTSAERCKLS